MGHRASVRYAFTAEECARGSRGRDPEVRKATARKGAAAMHQRIPGGTIAQATLAGALARARLSATRGRQHAAAVLAEDYV